METAIIDVTDDLVTDDLETMESSPGLNGQIIVDVRRGNLSKLEW